MNTLPLQIVAVGVLVMGCAGTPPPPPGADPDTWNSIIRLDIPRRWFPAPGLCRVFARSGGANSTATRSCDVVLRIAPLGSTVLYRPENSRELHIRYMDVAERGLIYRTDIYDIDTGRLIREIN